MAAPIPQADRDHAAKLAARLRARERAIARLNVEVGALKGRNAMLEIELEQTQARLRAREAELYRLREERNIWPWPRGMETPIPRGWPRTGQPLDSLQQRTYRDRIGR